MHSAHRTSVFQSCRISGKSVSGASLIAIRFSEKPNIRQISIRCISKLSLSTVHDDIEIENDDDDDIQNEKDDDNNIEDESDNNDDDDIENKVIMMMMMMILRIK